MNYRLNTTAIIAVSILVLVAAALFGYTYFMMPERTPAQDVSVPVPSDEVSDKVVTAMHQYEDGIHTIAGELEVPTPCHRLEAEAFMTDSSAVEVRLTTVAEEGDMCAQVLTPARFKVVFEAPEDATIAARLDGTLVTLNLVPVPPGESLDDFELFIKG